MVQNERGRYYSEGEWEILGKPRTDGYDSLTWIADQPWSNGRVATWGCSSTAEWQMALAAQDHPAHAAMIPMASGAGIGRVGGVFDGDADAGRAHDLAVVDDHRRLEAVLDPLGNAVHTALSFPILGEDVLITGAGPIGIMAAMVAAHSGARNIVITDLNQ